MREIAVVTVARSDYGILRPVLRAIEAHRDLRLRLLVGGMHLEPEFGSTVSEIEADGFEIADRIAAPLDADDPRGVAGAIARGVDGFASAYSRARPDVLLLLGDRYETFAAALAALPFALPLAHVHGGESTEGAIDEGIRHSLTKLSHLHFAATEGYARRIVQLGEEPWRVTVSGAPAVDEIQAAVPLPDSELAARGIRLRGPTLLVTYHPVTLAHQHTADEVEALLSAIGQSGFDAVLTYPNADTSHRGIVRRLEQFAGSSERYALVRSLGSEMYFTLMSRAAAMVGNSSSGIIEAASFELPVVDVGIRQRGRVRAKNVVHAESDTDAILAAIERATSPDFRERLAGMTNPYGDGHAAKRIVERLAAVPLDERLLLKRFYDVPFDSARDHGPV